MKIFLCCLLFLLISFVFIAESAILTKEQIKRSPFLKGRMLDDEHDYYNNVATNPKYKSFEVTYNGKPILSEDDNPFKYSGFYNVNKTIGGMMYYAFFEAKDGNKQAPIILWLQGGPGCSSMTGLLIEGGPFRINKQTLQLEDNPYTWNQHYHMLFIDNPLGSGFSHFLNGTGYVTDEELMADELYNCLLQFFAQYSQYATNPFFVFGESYAGKYVPSISYKIANEGFKINLQGFGVGDGLTHSEVQMAAYDEYAYSTGLIDEAQRKVIQNLQNQVVTLIQQKRFYEATSTWDKINSALAQYSGNVNVYDIRLYGDYDFDYFLTFLNLPKTKELMHTTGVTYDDCNSDAYSALYADMSKSVKYKVESLLNRGVRGILYNGQVDLIINMVQTKWIEEMNWRYSTSFFNAERKPWKVNNQIVGYAKQYANLYKIAINGAGHLSPMDQPEALLDMVTRFIEKKDFY
ncbi:hypothetical protein ABK040_005661 [Willaertia magna]